MIKEYVSDDAFLISQADIVTRNDVVRYCSDLKVWGTSRDIELIGGILEVGALEMVDGDAVRDVLRDYYNAVERRPGMAISLTYVLYSVGGVLLLLPTAQMVWRVVTASI